MKAKLLITIFFGGIMIASALSFFTGYSIVVVTNHIKTEVKKYNPGDIVDIFDKFNFNEGNWAVYLKFSKADLDELKGILPKRTCLKLSNIEILNKMKEDWKMVCTGGDLATVESSIIILKDGDVVFKSGLMINKHIEGMQSRHFGWIEPLDKGVIKKYCKKFKPVYWPLVIL